MSVTCAPPSLIAFVMEAAAPRPVGSGAEMWKASAVAPAPRSSARMVALRAFACASDSTTKTAPPSPKRKPSRFLSNGRLASVGSLLRLLSAPMLPSAANAIGRSGASTPPAMTMSASPLRMRRSASWKARTPVAQAAAWVIAAPVRPYFMLTMQAPMLGLRAGMANALTKRPPFSRKASLPIVTCSIPPPPVLMTVATRSRRSASHSWMLARPASSMASVAAATANCTKRLMRRAIFISIVFVGSKSFTSAAICTSLADGSKCVMRPAPEVPAISADQ